MNSVFFPYLNFNRIKIIFAVLFIGFFLFSPKASHAQTTLAAGDIAFLTYDADNPDRFTFVLLKDIAITTVINFTDNGFASATTGRTGEGFLTFTADAGYTAGTKFTWTNGMTITGTPWSSNNPTNFAFNASGDQIFAFQGSTANWATQTGITLIAGINQTLAFINTGTATASNSYAPSGLSSSFITQISLENGYFANGTSTQTTVTVNDTKANLQTLFFDGTNKWFVNGTGPLTIPTYSVTVSSGTPSIAISSSHPAAGNVNQNTTDNIIGVLKLDVTVANATLTGVTVTTAGTYTAADIQTNGMKFWINSAANLSGATQLGSSQSAVGNGNNVVVSGLSQSISTGTTRYIIFTGSVSSGATAGHTIGITSTAFSNITFSAGTKTGTDPVPASNLQTVVALTPSIAISNGSPAAGNINQNSTNNILRSIQLDVTVAAATLTGITVTTAGTYQTSDLQANGFKFWINSANNLTGATQLGTNQAIVASGNNISVSGLSQSISSGTTRYILITVDVAYNANTSRNISITSTAFSNITFSTGAKTGTDPVAAGNTQTFAAVTPSIAITQLGPTAGNLNYPTTSSILYQLSFAVTSNTTDFNGITVTTGGTYQVGDLTASSFKLWYNTSNTFGTASQIGTSQAIVATGNNVTFSGLTQNIVTGTTGYIWVTVDVSASAAAGRTINITSTSFSNITFSAGTKTGTNPAAAGGAQTFTAAPSITEVLLPQYAVNGTTAGDRIPFVCRLTLNNLLVNSTYRYTVAASTDGGITTANGAGNMFAIYNTSNADGYIRGYTSGKSLNGTEFSGNEFTSSNRYATFTTDGSGSYTGWFSMIPTGNAVFNAGNNVYFYVQINDGGSGTAIAQSVRTTNTITILSSATGTSIKGPASNVAGENMVFLYDNTLGTGRPLYGTWTESDGITETFSTWYTANVDGTSSAWGAVIPSSNANGMKRVEFRSPDSNTLKYALTDADGVWNGVSTVNPTAGYSTPLSISNTACENFNVSGNVTVASNLTISGTLTLSNGTIDMGANTLEIGTSTSNVGAISRTGGSIKGTIKRWFNTSTTTNSIFPLDDGSSNYVEASVSFTGAPATGGSLTATFHTTGSGTLPDQGNGNYIPAPELHVNFINLAPQYWTITAGDGLAGFTYDIKLLGNGINVSTTNYQYTGVVKRANSGNPWAWDFAHHVTTTSPGAVPTLGGTGFTSFSDFGIGGNVDNLLPVELASFSSTISGRNVNLSWATVTESNNSGFDIERKSTTTGWAKIGSVEGHGTTNEQTAYSFSDVNVTTGKYNYRLKQTDYNGNFHYYDLSNEVVIGTPTKYSLAQNFPNPFNPSTSISYEIPNSNFVSLKIYDMMGKEVVNLVNENQEAGFYTVKFDASKLSSGIYFYKLVSDKFSATKKLMLLK